MSSVSSKNDEPLKLEPFVILFIIPTKMHLPGKHQLETSVFSNKLSWQAARFPGATVLKQLYSLGCICVNRIIQKC